MHPVCTLQRGLGGVPHIHSQTLRNLTKLPILWVRVTVLLSPPPLWSRPTLDTQKRPTSARALLLFAGTEATNGTRGNKVATDLNVIRDLANRGQATRLTQGSPLSPAGEHVLSLVEGSVRERGFHARLATHQAATGQRRNHQAAGFILQGSSSSQPPASPVHLVEGAVSRPAMTRSRNSQRDTRQPRSCRIHPHHRPPDVLSPSPRRERDARQRGRGYPSV
jgi:hypothetical protein